MFLIFRTCTLGVPSLVAADRTIAKLVLNIGNSCNKRKIEMRIIDHENIYIHGDFKWCSQIFSLIYHH